MIKEESVSIIQPLLLSIENILLTKKDWQILTMACFTPIFMRNHLHRTTLNTLLVGKIAKKKTEGVHFC